MKFENAETQIMEFIGLKVRPHGRTRSFVRVRPSQPRTRTKVRVRVRVRRTPTMLDFLYVVHVYDVQMFELAVFR